MRKIEKVAATIFHNLKPDCDILVDYDEKEDVLYVNFLNSNPQKADFARRFGDYILRIKDGLVIGITILSAQRHFRSEFDDIPEMLKKPSRP